MTTTEPVFQYKTARLGVRPLALTDIQGPYQHWLNDPEVCKFNSHGVFPTTSADLEDYVKALKGDRSKIVWAIVDLKSHRHIGNVSLQAINYVYRSAEFAIVLGEKDFWGKGLAYEASFLICKHGFERLNLHRIHCGCAAENTGMVKLAQSLKMSLEGTRRESMFLNGKYVDGLEFGVLRNEFFAR